MPTLMPPNVIKIDPDDPKKVDQDKLGKHVADECTAFIQSQNMFTSDAITRIAEILQTDYRIAINRGDFPWEVNRQILEQLGKPFDSTPCEACGEAVSQCVCLTDDHS